MGTGKKSEPVQLSPEPGAQVTVDALHRLDLHRDVSAEDIMPVNSYRIDLSVCENLDSCTALRSFANGNFHGVILVMGADQVQKISDTKFEIPLPLEDLYKTCLRNLLSTKCLVVKKQPIMVLVNHVDLLRSEGQSEED